MFRILLLFAGADARDWLSVQNSMQIAGFLAIQSIARRKVSFSFANDEVMFLPLVLTMVAIVGFLGSPVVTTIPVFLSSPF